MNRVWVAIADNNEFFRSSFARYLCTTKEIVVMAEADTGQAAIELVASHRPDVLLMDSDLSGIDGYETARIIASKFPETKVIILTMCASKEHREKAASAGAAGCISKGIQHPEMVRAIQAAILSV